MIVCVIGDMNRCDTINWGVTPAQIILAAFHKKRKNEFASIRIKAEITISFLKGSMSPSITILYANKDVNAHVTVITYNSSEEHL